MKNHWTESIHSDVTPLFVTSLHPAPGEEITIKLRLARGTALKEVQLRRILNGAVDARPMAPAGESGPFQWYALTLTMEEPRLQYQFLLRTEEENYFYTRRGITTIHPTEDHDFVIDAGTFSAAPDWVARSVFYQIYPDRFFKGDPSVDVQTGAYTFDGGEPRAMSWTDTPLEFPEGRCMDFFNGDLEGIRQKIPYLKDLGVNALYLNPVFQARTTHRYDCTDYFAVDQALGGDDALIRLTEALHAEGMKIILDVSINHTGTDHRWFQKALADPHGEEASYYYIDPETGEFAAWLGVPTLPQLNYNSPALRRIIWEDEDSLVRRYLKPPFSIDGWRFDVGNMTGRRGTDQLGHLIFREIRRAAREVNPQAYIIGEHWEDSIAYLLGDQWDGAMNYFACARPLRRFAGAQDVFIEGHDAPPRAVRPTTGRELKEQIEQHFTRLPNPLAQGQLNLLGSHDIHRFHHHPAYHPDIYAGLVILQFLLPGTPCLYYGDELALEGHPDTMEGCRYPMAWHLLREDAPHQARRHLSLHRLLAHLKLKEPALHQGSWKSLSADGHTYALARFDAERAFIGVANNNPEASEIFLEVGLLGISRAEDLLTGVSYEASETGILRAALKPRQALLLRGLIQG